MILSVDTSTLTMSLALVDGDRVVKESTVGPPTRLSQALPDAITALTPLDAITGFVVGVGPGSFTGLRISLACVKGLAYARKVPTVGVSSLAAVEADAPAGHEAFSAAVVKKGELYLRRDGKESVVTVDGFGDAMRERPFAIALGPGIVAYRPQLIEKGIEPSRLLETVPYPRAATLARLAGPLPPYDAQALFALEPHYLRSSGAEDNPKFPPLPGVPATARLKE